ncbi:hypothetical protein BG262_00665 [Floricoccus penangensis]|uniref:Lantibiotic ABC transporter permease n=1 Tax=Floricoccus penangensis TaxID=1859475 RepID=A0A9Q5JGW1_9LACT|nr:lantibiotic immunity ABC transporter MutE/EpiE family permease subunit [Floricoccus penangensis]OFI47167.1 hypothetical protein BG262_00665 [Floricoccus penangensis]
MLKILKSEWLKEKRSANAKLLLLVPIIFTIFNLLMVRIMGINPVGQSYIMATAFNWYPLIILPTVISLLVVNITKKEKETNKIKFKSLGLDYNKQTVSKNLVVVFELAIMIIITSIIVYCLGTFLLGETIPTKQIILASFYLFIGSLPIIGISFLSTNYLKGPIIIILNFILTILGAPIATENYWWLYPWSYSLRMLCPILGIYPNGLFLENDSYLFNSSVLYLGTVVSLMVWLACLIFQYLIDSRRDNV